VVLVKWPRITLAESKRSRPDLTERGDNDVSCSSSRKLAEQRLRELDHNYEWRGSNKWRICDRMRKSDPKIAGLRSAQTLPLLRTEAQITGSEDEEKVEFVRKALLEDFPWRAFLQSVATYVDYGFAAFAVNWRIDGDESARIDELRYLPPSSIRTENIHVSRGSISRIVQTPITGAEQEVPGEYLLWFAHAKEGDNFTGRPILRAMHKPWFTKERLEVLLPVLVEKMGGVPVFTEQVPLSTEQRAVIDEMGESFVIGERQYIRKPSDVDFELVESHVDVADILEAIRYFDTQLTNVCQAQYLDLGVNQAGSRAYGTTLADMFSDAVQAQASCIEDVLNARNGLIHQLVAYNFPTDDDLPKLRFSSVQHTDIQALAKALQALGLAGMPFDEETWDFIRSEMNLPATTTSQTQMPGEPAAPADKTPDAKEAPDETGARASDPCCSGHGLRLAERRPPRGVECYVALDELSSRFDNAKTAIREATQATRDKLVAELASRARAAAEKGALEKFAAGAPPMVDKLAAEIRAVLEDFYVAGRRQVADELQRQREGQPVVEETIGERQGERVAMADKPRKPGSAIPPDAAGAIRAQADAQARTIAEAAKIATVVQAGRIVARVPVTDAVFEEMVRRESDAVALRVSAVVTDLMQMGRADQAAAQASEIADAVYSAILDGNACEVCEPMDGETTTDLDEAADWAPNPGCLGSNWCRCVVIYEYRQEAS